MVKTKLFEVRDEGTCILVLAIKLDYPEDASERWLLSRAGYDGVGLKRGDYVLLATVDGGHPKINYNPHSWDSSRTMPTAHHYIRKHFDSLESGQVVDVRCILGETDKPCASDRLGWLAYES